MSQIIGFVNKSLSKLIKISNEKLERTCLKKEIINVKDKQREKLIRQSRKQEQDYKEGSKEYFSFQEKQEDTEK